MRFIYLILALGLIDAAILLGGELSLFVNAPSILIVVGCGFSFTLAAHGYAGLKNAMSAACGTKINNGKEGSSHALVLLTLRNSFLGAGAVGTFIGLVQMLVSLDDPSLVGPSLAVALLTMTYGFILAELVVTPAMDRMLVHGDAANPSDIQMAKSPIGLHLAMLFVAVGVFMTLLYSMSGAG
jgi:flagellar motor component MotA